VLPYRSGTATQNAELAFAHGVPVIATRVGNIPQQLHDGVDSVLCTPGDVASLATAIRTFYDSNTSKRLQTHLPKPNTEQEWQVYVQAIAVQSRHTA
jgi:glycosyltransferase involved in cell wall biosynthesis